MKAIVSIVLLFFLQNLILSQDTAIVKYLPLKVGNVWVYNWISWSGITPISQGQVKITISGTVQSNGHTYYNIEQTGSPCHCSFNSFSPFLIQLNNPIRIDSITGNIFWKSSTDCGWHFGESLFDSLKMVPVNIITETCFLVSCFDTSTVSLFGNSYPSKYVGQPIMNDATMRRYAKWLGLAASNFNCYFSTTCTYNLAGCVLNGVVYGDTTLTGINSHSSQLPDKYTLSQNYPNPFNPVTKIKFDIPLDSRLSGNDIVTLKIYDVLGREIATLVNEQLNPGTYEAEWDGSNFPSGVYFYKLITAEYTETRKMVLLK